MIEQVRHTPGPWRVANNGRSVLAGSVKINQQNGPAAQSAAVSALQERELMANAKLIAASPELLEALQRIREDLIHQLNPHTYRVNFQYVDEAICKGKS